MKRSTLALTLLFSLVGGLVLTDISAAFSAPPVAGSTRAAQPGAAFVDTNGDGVCDHRADGGRGRGRRGGGAAFVDADGDGVCDHRVDGGPGRGRCGGGAAFVDADGDGVCDHRAAAGCGGGRRGGHGRGRCGGR